MFVDMSAIIPDELDHHTRVVTEDAMKSRESFPFVRAEDLGLLLMRVGVGVVFAWHGWLKFDGGVANFATFLDSLNVPAPEVVAWLQVVAEGVGGVMLVVGLLTRYVTLPLIATMIGAIVMVKIDVGFIVQNGAGAEFDVALLAGLFGLLFIGAGRLSLDAVLGLEKRTPSISPDNHARVDA
jgi:putative oxidoreductase